MMISMQRKLQIGFYLCSMLFLFSCVAQEKKVVAQEKAQPTWKPGAHHFEEYLPQLAGKQVGVVAHHCSLVDEVHLVDTLLSLGVDLAAVFAPEHGFRGKADAGAKINNERLEALPVFSLYGKNFKPKPSQLEGVDVVLFDLQDVGARFYTYVSTLYYVMEACAEQNVELIVLDRPNPNAHRVAGPVLDTAFSSFVGVIPVPVLYGLTIGELATMMNDLWMKDKVKLSVVFAEGFQRGELFELNPKPSPNLPSLSAIQAYPSLCFFEGTPISAGRGTQKPFELYAHPNFVSMDTVRPTSTSGASKPKFKDKSIPVFYYSAQGNTGIDYAPLVQARTFFPPKKMFNSFFDLLAGTDRLRLAIDSGMSAKEIEKVFQPEINVYLGKRMNYLHYSEKK